jgi:uncharacterized iron-regulated membrane protein
MGVMIIVIFAVIVVELIHRMQNPDRRTADTSAETEIAPDADQAYEASVGVPADAVLAETHTTANDLVLVFQMPDGGAMFKVIDPRTGQARGSIEVPAGAALDETSGTVDNGANNGADNDD